MNPIRYRNLSEDVPVDYWPTIGDFLAFVEPSRARQLVPHSWQWGFDGREWAGGLTYNDAWNMCLSGMTVSHPEFQLREDLLRRIRRAPTEQPTWDVTGGAVEMGNYLAGIPECMLDYERVSGRAPKTISLLLQVNARCDADPDQLRMRGVAYMGLIDALELSRQYMVAVYAVVSLSGWHSCICLKTHGHQYDPHALGFVLGHPSFLRRLHFCAQDIIDPHNALTIAGPSYGWPRDISGLPSEIDTNVVNIGQRLAGNPLRNPADAVRWVEQQLATFNLLDKEGIA